MKTTLALVLALALVALLFPEDSEARQVPRLRGRKRFSPIPRSGRTAQSQDYPEPPPPAGDDAAGEEGGDVPDWCNHATNMGAWLNFGTIRAICGERGFSDFGPYGGVPAEGEEAAEEA